MYLPMPAAMSTLADFFNPLMNNIERMLLENAAPYPVERTLLTSGMTLRAVESLYRNQSALETPELDVTYTAPGNPPIGGHDHEFPSQMALPLRGIWSSLAVATTARPVLMGYPRDGALHTPPWVPFVATSRRPTRGLERRKADFNLDGAPTVEQAVEGADAVVIVPRGSGATARPVRGNRRRTRARGRRHFQHGALTSTLTAGAWRPGPPTDASPSPRGRRWP